MRGFVSLLASVLLISGSGLAQDEPPVNPFINIFGPTPVVVYENVDTFRGEFTQILPTSGFGDTVWLAGFARNVIRVELLLGAKTSSMGPALPLEAELALWQPGPPPTAPFQGPGTLIWKSGYLPFALCTAAKNPISFRVPEIRVNNFVIWTVTFRNFQAYLEVPVGQLYGPPTVGDGDPSAWWFLNPLGAFWQYGGSLQKGSFFCRIIAR